MRYIKLFEKFNEESTIEDIKQYIQIVVDDLNLLKIDNEEWIKSYANRRFTFLGNENVNGAAQIKFENESQIRFKGVRGKIYIQFLIDMDFFRKNMENTLDIIQEFENRLDEHLDDHTMAIVDVNSQDSGNHFASTPNDMGYYGHVQSYKYEILIFDKPLERPNLPFGHPGHLWSLKLPDNALSKLRRKDGRFYTGAAFINNLQNVKK